METPILELKEIGVIAKDGVIYTTHNMETARHFADRIVAMRDGLWYNIQKESIML